jgi:hypothetical protein
MAIDREIFAQCMGFLGGRIGRPLEAPVLKQYYLILSAELTTQEFVAAATLEFRTWDARYRTWPSPKDLIALIRPVAAPALSAAEAFEQVLEIANRHEFHERYGQRREDIAALGAAAMRAFRAAGGFRDMTNAPIDQVVWLRKRFVEAYETACQHADAERDATMALAAADERLQQLVGATVAKLPSVESKRLSGGSR